VTCPSPPRLQARPPRSVRDLQERLVSKIGPLIRALSQV
jgi:hypothetical protein